MPFRKKARGQLIVLSGPSGVGKSTVISELLGQRQDIHFSVSFTTRQPRWERPTALTTILWIGRSLSG